MDLYGLFRIFGDFLGAYWAGVLILIGFLLAGAFLLALLTLQLGLAALSAMGLGLLETAETVTGWLGQGGV